MKNFDNPAYLKAEYIDKKRGTSDIGKELGVHPNTIRRALIRHGFKLRTRSEAQFIVIEKHGAPMEGKVRTDEDKARISSGLKTFWDEVPVERAAEIKETRRAAAAERWGDLSEEEQAASIRKMHGGSRAKMRSGSKNENMVADMLKNKGYTIQQRNRDYTPGGRFEIDIVLPKYQIAIEWDGATHFLPIYGDDHLAAVQAKDKIKDGVLTSAGWHVIRARDHSTSPSIAFCERAVEKIEEVISEIVRSKSKKTKVYLVDAK